MARFVALAMLLCASTASAQNVEVLRSDAEGADVRVSWGGTYQEMLEALVPVLPAGMHAPSRDRIAESNPGRMRFVCYEAGRHARPTIRRERSFYDACEDYPRGIWFVAGVTYSITFIEPPGMAEEAPVAANDAEVERLRAEADTLRARLETRADEILTLNRTARETEARLDEMVSRLRTERDHARRETRGAGSAEWRVILFCVVLILLLAGCVLVFRRQQRIIRRAMRALRKSRERRDEQLSKERRAFHLLRGALSVEETSVANHRSKLENSQKEIQERKQKISELLERKAELRPLEVQTMRLRDRLVLLKRLKEETPEDDIKQYTDPAYDKLIQDAQAELDGLGRSPEEVVKEAGEIRAELAGLLEEATGFRDDMVAVDSDLVHQRELLSDAKARASMDSQMFQILRVQLKSVYERLESEQKTVAATAELLEGERASIKAERTTYEEEIRRYKKQADTKDRELANLKIEHQKLDGKYTAQLFAGALGETEAIATLEGKLRGIRSKVAEQDELLEETRKAIESRFHEVAEVRRTLEQTTQQLSGAQSEILLKDARIRELEQQLGLARHSQIATRSDGDPTRPMRRGPDGQLIVKAYGEPKGDASKG